MIGQSKAQTQYTANEPLVRLLLCFGLVSYVCHTGVRSGFTFRPASRSDRASAYYAFGHGSIFTPRMAARYGNRGEYVNKAIDFYKQAIKADPSASYIAEERSESLRADRPAREGLCSEYERSS